MNGKRVMKTKKPVALVALLLLLCCTVAGTLAYLVDSTDPVTNTFTPASVSTEVNEDFDGITKSNVTIKNTGDIPAYIRAAVIINWADGDGNVSATPVKTTDYTIKWTKEGWVEHGGYYYYTAPVAVGALTGQLFTGCELAKGVTPPEGYSLQVTILADGIQSEPADAVIQAWGVDPSALTNG